MIDYKVLLDIQFPPSYSSTETDYLILQLKNKLQLSCAELKLNYKLSINTTQKPEANNV